MKQETIKKYQEMLGDKKQLLLIKGQLLNPVAVPKKDSGELYCTFNLKESKMYSQDEYGQAFNNYHCIIPADVFGQIGPDAITAMKGNEVIILVEASCFIKKLTGTTGQFTVNNISLYVHDIALTKQLQQELHTPSKVVSL